MRLRLALRGSLLAALIGCALPGPATAAPHHNNGLTIHVAPNPIIAGDGVLIYGQLTGTNVAGQQIVLYHRIPPRGHFSVVGRTTTDSYGLYEFPRAEGVVYSNRGWFVRGPDETHSRTVHERVAALVDIQASTTNAVTRQPIVFSGHVTPNHAFERVLLQTQRGSSDDWHTIARTRLSRGSDYSLVHRFHFPGQRDVRVLFRGDDRNVRSASDPVTITVQQRQAPGFTISSSSPIISVGPSATIAGKLYTAGTNKPGSDTPVTLCGRESGQSGFTCDTAGVTSADGSYSFNVSPEHNEVYVVRTTLPPHRHTARLLEGVRDDVSMTASPASAQAGQKVAFSGSATPDKAGDTVYLERLGSDGDWHIVGVSRVQQNSTFQFVRVFGTAGTKTFRARVLPDPQNLGGVSGTVNVSVSEPSVTSLPEQR